MRNKTPLRLAPWLWTEQSGPCAAYSGTSWMSFLVFMMHHVSQSLCVSFSQHFTCIFYIYYVSFSNNLIMYCTISWRLTTHYYLSSVGIYMVGLGEVGNFLQKVQRIGITTAVPGSFFYIDFLCIFSQFRCKTVSVYIPSVVSVLWF